MGVVTGCVLLVSLFLFIPVPFSKQLFQEKSFPHDEVSRISQEVIMVT
jgi:UDP-N-acetylglucosamine--dolichyl-phosphate N-acetylglucosaminephosphotransferase